MTHEDILLEKINILIEENKVNCRQAYLRGFNKGIRIDLHIAIVDGNIQLSTDELIKIKENIRKQLDV